MNNLLDLRQDIDHYRSERQQHDPSAAALLLPKIRDRLRAFRTACNAPPSDLAVLCRHLYDQSESYVPLRLLLASFFFDWCKDKYFWEQTITLAADLAGQDHTPSTSYNLLLNAEYLGFASKTVFDDRDYLHNVRMHLKNWYRQLDEQPAMHISGLKTNTQHKRLAILLRLWREPRLYTPALEALDYAYLLNKKYGYDIALFNCNLLHDQMPWPFWPVGQFSPLPDKDEEMIVYKDAQFPVYHRRGPSLDTGAAADFWRRLVTFSPAFGLALGDCNLYADAAARNIPVVTHHYTIDAPIQIRTIAGYQCTAPDIESACASMLDAGCRRVPLRPAATDVPVTINYTREAFRLPKDAFIFVIIGNRLRSEITMDFLKVLNTIGESCRNARFVFVGFYDQAEDQMAAFASLRAQGIFIPHIDDVRAFMGIADVMLNPFRAGGGHSAVQSMAEGKPVVTLARGDVPLLLGLEKVQHCLSEYINYAVQLASNADFYRQAVLAVRKRYIELIDRSANIESILNAL